MTAIPYCSAHLTICWLLYRCITLSLLDGSLKVSGLIVESKHANCQMLHNSSRLAVLQISRGVLVFTVVQRILVLSALLVNHEFKLPRGWFLNVSFGLICLRICQFRFLPFNSQSSFATCSLLSRRILFQTVRWTICAYIWYVSVFFGPHVLYDHQSQFDEELFFLFVIRTNT